MEPDLFEHILQTETLNQQTKSIAFKHIKSKIRMLLIFKVIMFTHLILIFLMVYIYSGILKNTVGVYAVSINFVFNIVQIFTIRARHRNIRVLMELYINLHIK